MFKIGGNMSETENNEEYLKFIEELKAKSRRCDKCGHFHEYYIGDVGYL